MDLSKQLDGFELKLRQLASKLDRQRAENEALHAENDQLKSQLDRQRGVVSSLKEKLEKAAASAADQPLDTIQASTNLAQKSREEIQEQIDFCLSEIDKCIDWLEQQ
ncbi:MAG: hypothetical protein AAFU67_04410 [Bacteroidota bacterium]